MDARTSNHPGPSGAIAPNDPRLARCGFAKLQGDGIEFFVRKYEITMGRTSKNSTLDLILGDSTTISRQHATIRFNFDNKCFELVVLGKNGVQVESSGSGEPHLYTPDSPPTPLRSRDLLIMGEKRFYFLLPRTMGGQSRKRRRLEPSPAPGAVTSSAQPQGAVSAPLQAPASGQHLAHHVPPAAGALEQEQGQQQLQQAAPAAAVHLSPTGGVPVSHHSEQPHAAAQLQPQVQHQQPPPEQHQRQPELHSYAQLPSSHDAGGIAVQQYDSLQDDDDALINAGGLPYDNGAPYGYETGNNGFPGGF